MKIIALTIQMCRTSKKLVTQNISRWKETLSQKLDFSENPTALTLLSKVPQCTIILVQDRFFNLPIWKPMAQHPVYFKKNSAAPFGNRSPLLRGAWICSWAHLQNLQGGAAPPHLTETRWTEKDKFLCLSAPPVQAPHFERLLCWMGVARYSRNYSGCQAFQNTLTFDQYLFNSRSNFHLNLVHLNSLHPKSAILTIFFRTNTTYSLWKSQNQN